MSVDVPEWIPRDVVGSELKRITELGDEEQEAQLQQLQKELESLGSIRKCEVSKSGVSVVERLGLMATKIGGDIGHEMSGHANMGYANFFKRGETFELRAKTGTSSVKTFSFIATLPLLSKINASNACSFSRACASLEWDTQTIAKYNIEVGSAEASFKPLGRGWNLAIAASVVQSKRDEKTPTVVASDPSHYFKVSARCDLPRFIGSGEISCVIADKKFLPFAKLHYRHSINLGYGFSIRLGGGVIITEKAVPFPEKFRVGGVPSAYGINQDKFGTTVGGFPSGNDWWSSVCFDFATFVLPQHGLNGHFFVNAALAGNRKSNCVLDYAPSITKVVSAGAGLTFNQGPFQFQANVQYPYVISSGLEFLRFQVGICPL